jgi:autotransporter-associated beta strand protein
MSVAPRRPHPSLFRATAIVICSLVLAMPSHAAVASWTGAGTVQSPTGGAFSDPANWQGDTIPVFNSNTELVFQFSGEPIVVTNDLGTLQLASLSMGCGGTVGADPLGGSRLIGGTLAFAGPFASELTITGSGQNVYIGSNLSLGTDLTLSRTSPAAGKITFIGAGSVDGGNIDLGSRDLRITRPQPSNASDVNRVFIGASGSTTKGVVQGTGRIALDDSFYSPSPFDQGPLTLHLASLNTYSGGTVVREGQLAIAGETTLSNGVVVSGPVGTGPVEMRGGVLRSGPTKRTIYNTVEVHRSFSLGQSGFQGITVAGKLELDGINTITVAANMTGSVEVSGPITEASPGSGILWDLQSDLTLTSVATYTGFTVVGGRTLNLHAPGSLGVSPLRLTTAATLAGDGQTGAIQAESLTTISPGKGIGVLHTVGNVTLVASRVSFELNTVQPGLGYDQWEIQGGLSLEEVDLRLIFGNALFAPADTFFLILNDGSDPVSGEFTRLNGSTANLSQGAQFTAGNRLFEISYSAAPGDAFYDGGNDVAIRVVPEPATISALLCGLLPIATRRARRKQIPA